MLVDYKNTSLYAKSELVDFQKEPIESLSSIIDEMGIQLNKTKALGISAPQIGCNKQIFLMRGGDFFDVVINPSIRNYSDEADIMLEGCLSFPGLEFKIRRPTEVRASYYDVNGQQVVKKFSGLSARIFQHEMDHLNGITIIHRISKLQLDMAMKKMYKHGGIEYDKMFLNSVMRGGQTNVFGL